LVHLSSTVTRLVHLLLAKYCFFHHEFWSLQCLFCSSDGESICPIFWSNECDNIAVFGKRVLTQVFVLFFTTDCLLCTGTYDNTEVLGYKCPLRSDHYSFTKHQCSGTVFILSSPRHGFKRLLSLHMCYTEGMLSCGSRGLYTFSVHYSL
jgi:hypothetical protein